MYLGSLSNFRILWIGHRRRAVIRWLKPRLLFASFFVIGGLTVCLEG
jgi:hypothetical protein